MKYPTKNITLKHLLINGKKQIGIQFYPEKIVQTIIKGLNNVKWSKEYNMAYVLNTSENLNQIFEDFKGIAWINCHHFFPNRYSKERSTETLDVQWFRNRKLDPNYRPCPEEYLQKLELKRYANSTVKTYINFFELFINHYKDKDLIEINEFDIRTYIQGLVQKGRSNSSINQAINAIKFYYEVVLEMPNRFYSIERPRKQKKLPRVIDKKDILDIINATNNIKHRCLVSLLYSAGLRLGELLNLKLEDIDSKRMVIRVNQAKGNKDRLTILSSSVLEDLRMYFRQYKPKVYLFEGAKGHKYSSTSVQKIVKRAAKRAGILQYITPHMLRHSFATHLLEEGTDIRYIQSLLGHNSSLTTEIYTHVATKHIKEIKSPLDSVI